MVNWTTHKTQIPYLLIVATQHKAKKKACKILIDEGQARKARINEEQGAQARNLAGACTKLLKNIFSILIKKLPHII